MRIIDADALVEQFNGVPDSEDKDIALMIINNAPTVYPNQADMRNITETPSSCITTNPNSVEAYHQSLKEGAV